MLQKQLLFALRRLGRHKLNTTINVLGLTLGVLACLVIYLFVSFEFSFDKGHPDGDRIYRLVRIFTNPNGEEGPGTGLTPPLATDLQRELPGFGTVASIYVDDSRVIVPNANRNQSPTAQATPREQAPRTFSELRPGELHHIAFVQPSLMTIFPRKWLAGNPNTALNNPFSLVLTRTEAERYFGGNNPQEWMGRTVVYHDSLTVSVTGIIDEWAQNSDLQFTDLLSYSTIATSFLQKDMNGWNMWETDAQAYVKLDPNVTPAQAERKFPAFVDAHKQQKDEKIRLALQPLADIHFNSEYNDNYGRRAHKPTLYALIGIALFILLIASINFINLSTAQAVQRAREIGVRKVLGSSRLGLTTQFLTETGLIVTAAMTLALLLANPVIRALQGFIPQGVSLHLGNPLTLAFIGLTLIVTCLLAGWYPARVLSAFQPVVSLRGQGTQQLNSRSYLRKALIVFQFTVSLLFIIGTLVIGRQTHYMLNNDLGFDKDAILTVRLQGVPRSQAKLLTTEFSRMPGVQIASLGSGSPAGSGHPGTALEYKGSSDVKVDAGCDVIDTNYIRLYGLALLAGRNFFAADTTGAYIINESASRGLGFQHPADAIGKVVSSGFGGYVGPIVGVIKDFHAESYHEAIKPFFYVAKDQWNNLISLKLAAANRTAGQVRPLLAAIEQRFRAVCPDVNFNARFFDEAIAQLYEREQKTAQVLNLAMAIAIFISCMGLFGLAAYTASQRTREIGIRKVLGASVPHLVSLLSRDFVVLVLLSTLIAEPIAGWAMHQWLQDFVYRTTVPWYIYAIAGLGAIAIALFTVSFQAVRAATANPVEALRSE
jgi:predicted permease